MEERIGIIILAGGEGSRIRNKKPFIQLRSKTLLQYVLGIALKLSDEIVVVIGKEDDYKKFRDLIPKGIRLVNDLESGKGPMMGLYTGMKTLSSIYSLVLPCDSPFVNLRLLSYLISRSKNVDAVIPIWPNRYLEPLHGVYRISTSLKTIEKTLKEGKYSILTMIERLQKVVYIPTEKLIKFDQNLLSFFNINDLKDLRRAERNLLKN
jgi:molybdopterin-guanine dinucleotide biosynthesis protein A